MVFFAPEMVFHGVDCSPYPLAREWSSKTEPPLDLVQRQPFHGNNLFPRLGSPLKGDQTRPQAEGFSEKFDQGGIGFSLDSRSPQPELEHLASLGIGNPAENGIGLGPGLDTDGESDHGFFPPAVRLEIASNSVRMGAGSGPRCRATESSHIASSVRGTIRT